MDSKEKEFEKVVREHKSTIYTVCYMFSKDHDEVQDYFQNSLINLWLGFDSFRGMSKLETWIWRVTLNSCISDERKKKRRGTTVALEMASDLFTDTDSESKQVQQLHARIGKLDVMDRALVLLWLENMSYDDIGAIMGISTKNVSVKLVRIREKLIEMAKSENLK